MARTKAWWTWQLENWRRSMAMMSPDSKFTLDQDDARELLRLARIGLQHDERD